jgi:hypothetical protein
VGIYYTLDGSTPTTASYVYSSPLTISYPTTLKFFSMDMAGNTESVKTESYTVDTIAPATTASPEGGTFLTPQSVSLSCTDGTGSGCALIYYTLDGSTPAIGKPIYTSPINIASTTTLKFLARDNAGNTEGVNTQSYTILDTIPDAFSFTDQTDVLLNTLTVSNTVTVSGTEAPAAISITDGEYSINGGSYTSVSATVNNGDTVTVRLTSSGAYSTIINATLIIGGVSDIFSVTTIPAPYTISFSLTGSGAMTCAPTTVSSGGSFECTLSTGSGYHLGSLLDNTEDVTAQISGTHYSVTNVTADHNVVATFLQNAVVLRISGDIEPYTETWHSGIQDAYNASADADDILTQALDFYENPDFNRENISIVLRGGFDEDFNSVTGVTILHGSLTITLGTVIVDNLIIQ